MVSRPTPNTTKERMRRASRVEALSYLALLIATIVKYSADASIGVTVLGPIHGVIYLAYVALIVQWHRDIPWEPVRGLMAAVVAALPFGGFYVERVWLQEAT